VYLDLRIDRCNGLTVELVHDMFIPWVYHITS